MQTMQQQQQERLVVRWWKAKDFAKLASLHHQCYPEENWKKSDFLRFAEHPNNTNVLKVIGVEQRDVVLGSLLYTLRNPDVCHIRRIATIPRLQRHGMAKYALRSLLGGPLQRKRFEAKVHERNLAGQALLKSVGFVVDANVSREKAEDGSDYYLFIKDQR